LARCHELPTPLRPNRINKDPSSVPDFLPRYQENKRQRLTISTDATDAKKLSGHDGGRFDSHVFAKRTTELINAALKQRHVVANIEKILD
jgi:hypothetical protein